MSYSEALVLILSILREMLLVEIAPKAKLTELGFLDESAIESLAQAIKVRSGITIDDAGIRHSRTVSDLAQLLAFQSETQTGRVQLSFPTAEESEDNGCEYPVWFATNRRAHLTAVDKLEFSIERDDRTHYGACTVFVPKSHRIGSTGSSWLKRKLTGTDDRLRLESVRELAFNSYWSSMKRALRAVDIEDRDVVVFIHGYNVSFVDAAIRSAQIGFDLSIKGAMIFFSWPSYGSTSAYLADEATIEASEAAIAEFMINVATRSNARAVHIIAHSMGNRGVLRAVSRIAAVAEERSRVRFEQIILAAPDVDADVFRQLCGAYRQISARTTLYVSAKDRAVEASGWLHQYPRVGLTPPIFVTPGIDTINVTNADLTMLGHGYVAEARDVLRDMHDLINHGTSPDRRFGLRAVGSESGVPFWFIGS